MKKQFPWFFFLKLRFIEHDENQSDKTKLIVKKNYNFSTFAYKYEREMTSCVKPCDISSEQWGRGCTPPPTSKSTVYKPGTNPGTLPDHSPAGEFPDPRVKNNVLFVIFME